MILQYGWTWCARSETDFTRYMQYEVIPVSTDLSDFTDSDSIDLTADEIEKREVDASVVKVYQVLKNNSFFWL